MGRDRIDRNYIKLDKEMNKSCLTHITLFTNPVHISLEKSVKQGDILSPKIFIARLEMVPANQTGKVGRC